MNKLMQQIAKFGIVGIICFVVDFVLYIALNRFFEIQGLAAVFPGYYLLSQGISFAVSTVANYLMSMKFVFERKEGMNRMAEFLIFSVLSVIGLVINEVCLFVGVDVIYANWSWMNQLVGSGFAKTFFKLGATGVVMVYNFISRKMLLEKKN